MTQAKYLADLLALQVLNTNVAHHINRGDCDALADYFVDDAKPRAGRFASLNIRLHSHWLDRVFAHHESSIARRNRPDPSWRRFSTMPRGITAVGIIDGSRW